MKSFRIELPKKKRGRPSKQALEQLETFGSQILEIAATLDFRPGARGWCYLLEDYGINKGQFADVQKLLVRCRKLGLIPLDIVSPDEARGFTCIERVDSSLVDDEFEYVVELCLRRIDNWTPFSFWRDKEVYIQMLVEKVDLRVLFEPICRRYRIPIANAKGWPDLNVRAEMMERFKEHELEGRQPVLLYCGDFDPAGLNISESYARMLEELEQAVGWDPSNLIVDRFGLNFDFIEELGLTWVENLMTSSGNDLGSPKHKDHKKPYVQNYIQQYGKRKVEANALVVRATEGRQLCEEAIQKYLQNPLAVEEYESELAPHREELREYAEDRISY